MPISSPADLVDWKFRWPPGLETEIFSVMGAKLTVMAFNEIFTAFETGIIDGADASGLTNNVDLGFCHVAKHANFRSFHSMPSDHLACRKDKWDSLTNEQRRIIDIAMQKLAFQTVLTSEVKNLAAKAQLEAKGISIDDRSEADRSARRTAARALVDSQMAFLTQFRLVAK